VTRAQAEALNVDDWIRPRGKRREQERWRVYGLLWELRIVGVFVERGWWDNTQGWHGRILTPKDLRVYELTTKPEEATE
jgi:hypothetical protein